MKLSAFAAGIAVCLAGFGGSVFAQNSNSDNNVTWIGSQEPSAPESASSTREEAMSVMRQARQDCKREQTAQERKDCMKSAQDDYNSMMSSAHMPSHRGSSAKHQQ